MDSKIAYWGLIAGIVISILGYPIDEILSYWLGYHHVGISGIIRILGDLVISLGFFTAAFFSKDSDIIRAAMMLVGGIALYGLL